ncbi:MAG TPA: isochorismatase family protein [Gaiellaceae bacterium]|nr:isochorismatase family protein [Gaiellaceae bacterium]
MPEPVLERFTPENTTILMVDYSIGFLNMFRSHTINDHLQGTVALAKIGLNFGTGFVVNLGAGQKPYPQLAEAIGDHEILYRGGEYDALSNPDVLAAIEATGRDRLVIGGISTEGCVIETAFGALRRGYTVGLVGDATAGQTLENHQLAVQRMVQAGVVPLSWLSLATELQYDWSQGDTAQAYFQIIAEASPGVMAAVQSEHEVPA